MTPAHVPRPGGREFVGQFASFCAVGAGGFLVDAGSLYVVLSVSPLNAYSGRVISYLVAATFTWGLNRRFTFGRSRTGGILGEWARYVFTGAVGGLANLGAYWAVVAWARESINSSSSAATLIPYIGVAVGSALGLILNFSLARTVVFRGRARPRPDPS